MLSILASPHKSPGKTDSLGGLHPNLDMFCPIPNNDSHSSSEMPKMIHNCSGLSPMISLWPLQKIAENHREFLSGWWCNNHLENYEFVNGKDYSHMEKKNMFQTKPPTTLFFCWNPNVYHCCYPPANPNISKPPWHPEKNHGLQGASLPSSVNQLNRPSCVTTIGL